MPDERKLVLPSEDEITERIALIDDGRLLKYPLGQGLVKGLADLKVTGPELASSFKHLFDAPDYLKEQKQFYSLLGKYLEVLLAEDPKMAERAPDLARQITGVI